MLIRAETPADFPAVESLLFKAFGQQDEHRLVRALGKSQHYLKDFSLVLEQDNAILGYVLLYPIQIESTITSMPSLALAPMAVLPRFQRQGLGKRLVNAALNVARENSWGSVMVLGHAEYYPKFGFKPASNWNITGPFEAPDEAFMAIELRPKSLPYGGKAVYPEPYFNF